jgi:predicted HTH transcriptional regulator
LVLSLGPPAERSEAMKDLSGMGNGGGGTLVYGIEEDPKEEGIPIALRPHQDRGLVGVLEDVARSSVRPPLLMQVRPLEGPGGFVLVVEILRSPLGPYMVEAYGDRRYAVRVGSRTVPMTEQQVRDAYALASRARERRGEVWDSHALPMKAATSEAWLTVSVFPRNHSRRCLIPPG